jgi:uncharacterized protein YjeT (DUF2065 family)
MQEFARGLGILYVGSGVFLLAFPETARKAMQVRSEFLQLSSGGLRMLGAWVLMMGAIMVAATTKPEMVGRVSEIVPSSSEQRRAA